MGLFDTGRKVAEAFPPGEFIKEELEARGWSQSDLAAILGRNTGTVSQIISGKQPINPRLAHELGAAFSTDAQSWMNLQTAYQLWKEQQEESDDAVRRRAALYSKAPVKEMLKRRWIESTESIEVLESQVCKFLEIPNIDAEPKFAFAARQRAYTEPPSSATIAWLNRAKQLASVIKAQRFSQKALEVALPNLRRLMERVDGVKEVPRILADAGIRVVAIEKLSSMTVDAVTFWIDTAGGKSPVIALSLRFDRLDWFWHTLLHEIDHIRNGEGMDAPCIDVFEDSDDAVKPPTEVRCDEFAASFSISRIELDKFIARIRPYFTSDKAEGFALRMKVHPAIAAGQVRNRIKNYSIFSPLVSTKVRALILGPFMCDGWGQEPQLQ